MKTAKFDTSFADTDTVRRERHGLHWDQTDYAQLKILFQQGSDLKTMCEALQRPADGVIAKLVSRGYIVFDAFDCCYYYYVSGGKAVSDDYHESKFTPMKEPVMSKNLIESKVFVNGTDATNMSDAEIFRLIAKTEGEIAKLKDIKTPSTKLQAAIDAMEADVVKLAEYVDNRE